MGLFRSIGGFFSTAAKAVGTGGISLIAPKLIPKPLNTVLNTLTAAQFPTSFKSALNTGLAVATRNPTLLAGSVRGGSQPMALNVGGILSQVGNIFGGNQNPIFSGISNVATLASQFVPQASAQTVALRLPSPSTVPALAGRMLPAVGRGFFNKYPNLATSMQQLRARGLKVKRSQLWNLLKRFGPELLVTGGLLTAAAISDLMVAGPGRRRMNPGNVTALRRSMRRLESFHKLCGTADKLRRPRGRSSKGSKGTTTQFVRQG